MDPGALRSLASRLLVVAGHRGPAAGGVRELLADLPGVTSTILHGCESLMWSDMVAERTAEIGATLREFVLRTDQRDPAPAVRLPEGEREAAAALIAAEQRPASLETITLDERLASAAHKEGFAVIDIAAD
jgi:hypothetical protein